LAGVRLAEVSRTSEKKLTSPKLAGLRSCIDSCSREGLPWFAAPATTAAKLSLRPGCPEPRRPLGVKAPSLPLAFDLRALPPGGPYALRALELTPSGGGARRNGMRCTMLRRFGFRRVMRMLPELLCCEGSRFGRTASRTAAHRRLADLLMALSDRSRRSVSAGFGRSSIAAVDDVIFASAGFSVSAITMRKTAVRRVGVQCSASASACEAQI
jgi:hypothetical protein